MPYRNPQIMTQESSGEDCEVFTGAKTFTVWPRQFLILADGNFAGQTPGARDVPAFAVKAGMTINCAFVSTTAACTASVLAIY